MKSKLTLFVLVIVTVLALGPLPDTQAQENHVVPEISIKKCLAKAGKYAGQDMIQVLGQLNATEADLADANEIVVTVSSDDISDPNTTTWTFPIDEISFKKGKYNYARTENASKKLFKLTTKNGKFTFMVKKTDLTGLSCPMSFMVKIGSYVVEIELDETIVNGPKKPIPIQFMMGVKDILRLDKVKIKKGKKFNTDSLSIKGAFTTVDAFDKNMPVVITLGSNTFTVPGQEFVSKKAVESCKTLSNEGPPVSAKFDSAKCTFAISIKKAALSDTGEVDFGVDIFGNDLVAPEKVVVPPDPPRPEPPRPYTFWELTHYDQSSVDWDYDAKFKGYKYPVSKWTDQGGYIVHERDDTDYDVAGASWYYTDPGDGAHLTRFTLWEELDYGSGTYDIDFYNFDLLFWPESLSLGQSQTDTDTFQGHIDYGITVDFEGTVTCSVTVAPKMSKVAYEGQKYSAVVFTEVLLFMVDFSSFSNEEGTFSVKLKTKYYAVPGIGSIKSERTATIKGKNLPVYGTFTMSAGGKETAVLVDTNLD